MRCSVNVLAWFIAAGLAAVSCSAEQSSQPAPAPVSQSAAPRQRIRVLGEESASLAAFERVRNQYEIAAGISVDLMKRDHAGVRAAIGGAGGPDEDLFDLVIVPHRMLGELVERGYVQPIDQFLRDASVYDSRVLDPERDLFPGWWPELSWYRGRPYGYPFQMTPATLWYREDLFDDEDEASAYERRFGRSLTFPRTPSELEQVAGFFHRPEQGLYGTIVMGRGDGLVSQWLQHAAMFDARILDSGRGDTYGDIVVNSPEAVHATEFYVSLLRLSPPEARAYAERDAVRAFAERRVALAVMRHDLAFTGEDHSEARAIGGLVYAVPPGSPRGTMIPVEGHTFLIPQRAPHARQAFALMQWALSHDAQVALLLNGGLAARPSSFSDQKVIELPKKFQNRPFMQILLYPRLLPEAALAPTPTVPQSDQVIEALSAGLSRIVAGEVAPGVGLDDLASRLEQILKGKARRRYRAPRRSPAD